MTAFTRLVALAIVAVASPLTQAGLISVASSRIFYQQIAFTSGGGYGFLEKEEFTFPANVRESQIQASTNLGQSTVNFAGSARLIGDSPQTLTAQINGNLNLRSPANNRPEGISYESQGFLTAFYVIDFNIAQRVTSDLQFIAGATEVRSFQEGAVIWPPYTEFQGSLWNLATNTTLVSFTTMGNWKGLLEPGRYRLIGRLDFARRLYGGTTGDPEVTSFLNLNGLVRSTLQVTPVPEPATLSLCAIAVALLGARRIKRRS